MANIYWALVCDKLELVPGDVSILAHVHVSEKVHKIHSSHSEEEKANTDLGCDLFESKHEFGIYIKSHKCLSICNVKLSHIGEWLAA